MAVRKIRDRWWVDIRYNFVRYRKKSPLNTKGGAQAHETYLRGALAKHGSLEHLGPKPPEAKPVTFAEFAERWMREYVAVNNKWSEEHNKRQVLNRYLLPAFGRLALHEIHSTTIEQLKSSLGSGTPDRPSRLSPKTLNNILAVLRKCLVIAIEWGELEHLPVIRRLRAATPAFRFLKSDAEVSALLAKAPPGMWRTALLVAVRTGLRYSELAGLEWEHVDLDQRVLLVQRTTVLGRSGPTKNNRIRAVPITSDVAAALRHLGPSTGPVFVALGTHANALRVIRRFAESAGVPHVGWHGLRHTFASRLATRGAPIRVVQDLLGHQSIQMTMRYSHVQDPDRHRAIALLEPEGGQPVVNARPGEASHGSPERVPALTEAALSQ